MALPTTKHGRNMYDMLSLLQKAVRRGKYDEAAYAANELESYYRKVLWSRMLVISAEDCFGDLTKELISLKAEDDRNKDNENIARALALMCKALKSRDACYFSCNFILDKRMPREIVVNDEEYDEIAKRFGSEGQMDMFEKRVVDENVLDIACLHKAIDHRDMDMIGYIMDGMRIDKRQMLWDALKDYAMMDCEVSIIYEIEALEKADAYVNRNRKNGEKDEIFLSKAVMLLCYCNDPEIGDVCSSEMVHHDCVVDWSMYAVKPIEECRLIDNVIPEWTFDCHTLKGKRMGKTDWDMTTTEQEALYPKKKAYFDEGSWLYIYEQDLRNGVLDENGIEPIRKYAETHEANPVKFIPYD